MDSSQHRWLEHISEPCWFVAMIDFMEKGIETKKLKTKDVTFQTGNKM